MHITHHNHVEVGHTSVASHTLWLEAGHTFRFLENRKQKCRHTPTYQRTVSEVTVIVFFLNKTISSAMNS